MSCGGRISGQPPGHRRVPRVHAGPLLSPLLTPHSPSSVSRNPALPQPDELQPPSLHQLAAAAADRRGGTRRPDATMPSTPAWDGRYLGPSSPA